MLSAQGNQRGIVQVVVLHHDPGLNHIDATHGNEVCADKTSFQSMQLMGTEYAPTERAC